MRKKINKIGIALSIVLVFLGMMGFGQTTLDPTKKSIQAWIHPSYNETGSHACDATGEYQDGRTINVLKPEYLHVYSGVLQLYPFSLVGCNGYNENNASDVLNLQFNTVTRPGYITVSGSHLSLKMLLEDQNKKNALKNAIVNYMTYNPAMPNLSKFEGVELDFENPSISDVKPFGPKLWNSDVPSSVSCWGSYQKYWSSYFQLINLIGDALHTMPTPKKLMIDCPEMSVDDPGCWDYGFFKNNPNVDYICVLAYDYMYSFPDQAVAPTNWVSNIVDYVISKMGGNSNNDVNMNKIIIGMPSYGYTLVNNEVVLKQKHDAQAQTAYYDISNNPRDADSYERYFDVNGIKWYYQDGIGMSAKIEKIREKGIKHVSVWSLGGNDWFNSFNVDFNNQPIDVNYKLPLFVTGNNWSATSQYQMDYVKNYDLSNPSTINQCAEINKSNLANNQLLLGNYAFGINPSNVINGFDVVVIGHSDPASNQLKSTFSIQLTDGTNYSAIQTFDIYSPHDIIKVFDKQSWGNIYWSANGIDNNFKVILKLVSGETGYINAVFVKAHSSTNAAQTATYYITNPIDDAADAININNTTTFDYSNTHHRFGIYKSTSSEGKYYVNGFRFRNINIPQGINNIQDAKLDLYFNPGTGRTIPNFGTFNMNFYCENSLNSQEFSSSNNTVSGSPSYRSPLTAPKPYTFNSNDWCTDNTVQCAAGYYYTRTIDVKDIIQPVIANPQWNPNNAGTSSISIIAKLQTTPTAPITTSKCAGYSTYESPDNLGVLGNKVAKLTITYNQPAPPPSPTISYSQNNGSVIVGNSFNSVVPVIQNMQGNLTFTASPALSNGLGFNSSGQITGIPTTANTTTYSITVSNGTQSASCLYTLTIAPLTFTYNPDYGYVSIGDNFNSSVPQTNLGGNLTYSCSTLPVGFSISPTNGQITGFTNNPNFTGGQYNVTVENNNNQSLSLIYYLQVYPPSISYSSNTLTLTKGTYGQSPIPVIKSLTGTRYFSSSPNLPIGLSFDNSGRITGTPLEAVYENQYTITVTNGTKSASCIYYIQVNNQNNNLCNAPTYPATENILSGSNGNNTVFWSSNSYHNDMTIIPSGITLKIINSIHAFAGGSGIEVKPGGKLIIDNAYLTTECYGSLWEGILLRGDFTKSQTDETSHGIVEIINNGTISNAIYGIKTLDIAPPTNMNNPFYCGGGIIKAENAKFINNQTAVRMNYYRNINPITLSQYQDFSYFRNCKFETNNQFMAPNESYFFNNFVDLSAIKGISFISCSFKNLSTNRNKYRGIGIKALTSKINVNAGCNLIQQNGSICPESETVFNEFSGLGYGIYYTGNMHPSYFCNIRDSKFENNYHGIYVGSTSNALIARNTFKVKDIKPNNTMCDYGAYLEGCWDFGFEGNKFEGENYNAMPNIGLIVSNSQTTMNTIYNNTFDLFDYATNAQNYNPSSSSDPKKSGLKIKCNDFTNSIKNDISVSPAGSTISKYQGYLGSNDAPAGNTFTPELNNQNDNGKFPINNEQGCGFFTYYYHKFNATNKYINPDIPPLSSTSNYNKEEVIETYNKITSCPAKILAPQSPGALQSKITVAQQQLNSAKLMYTIYKDNGNTQALKNAINLSYPWEAFELYNNLMSKSPSLSDEVLIDAIKREDVLPALLLKYILLANPQAVKSQKVWDALYHRNDPFPDAWIDELKQGAEIVSPLEQLEAQISYYAQERQFAYSQLKNIYVTDTSETNTTDSLINLLVNNNEAISDYELASVYLHQGEYTAFSNIMESIPVKYEYNEEEMRIHNDYIAFFDVMKFLIENNMDFGKLKTEHIDILNSLYENNRSFVSSYALSILMLINPDFEYIEPIYLPKELKMGKPYTKAKLGENNLLKAFPNPATNYFIVEYNITDAVKGASLEIVDMMNRKLESIAVSTAKGQTMIKTAAYAKGLYHCYLINNGKIVSQTKITVE